MWWSYWITASDATLSAVVSYAVDIVDILMDDTISRTDQVLVLLNRLALAVAGENGDAAHQTPNHQRPSPIDGIRTADEQQQQRSYIHELPVDIRASGHRRASQRASATGQREPGAALQIVLGDAHQDAAQHVFRWVRKLFVRVPAPLQKGCAAQGTRLCLHEGHQHPSACPHLPLKESVMHMYCPPCACRRTNSFRTKLFGQSKRAAGDEIVNTLPDAHQRNSVRVHPLSSFRRYWDLTTIALTMYTVLVLPFRAAFFWDYYRSCTASYAFSLPHLPCVVEVPVHVISGGMLAPALRHARRERMLIARQDGGTPEHGLHACRDLEEHHTIMEQLEVQFNLLERDCQPPHIGFSCFQVS